MMWPAPDDPHARQRMHAAHRIACTAMNVLGDSSGQEAWGWNGRTLGRPVTAHDGPAWLRLASVPVSQPISIFWDGSVRAQDAIPAHVPRPRLRGWHDWTDRPWRYRAELYDLYDAAAAKPVATSAVITVDLDDLPPAWWNALRTALDTISATPTDRVAVHQPFLDRAMPRYLGVAVRTLAPSPWTTAHGDLHFANLCAPNLGILDWEGWGLAPAGYDAAVLHTHSLLCPATAARIRAELAHILDTPDGRYAELVAITQLLHTARPGDNSAFVKALHARAAVLLGREPLAVC